ncbi:hypothetical protein B0T14DRAFT_566989 [Immersiella caudata]|uniref:Uncharacterized protein n=1 Tax=Immersiella caudata TaxID=314043 RepID=A0AA39WRJ4_9PEZI|nr:hypothetical protein B0T14DRAFT_566989 [Immersiella caudata]
MDTIRLALEKSMFHVEERCAPLEYENAMFKKHFLDLIPEQKRQEMLRDIDQREQDSETYRVEKETEFAARFARLVAAKKTEEEVESVVGDKMEG